MSEPAKSIVNIKTPVTPHALDELQHVLAGALVRIERLEKEVAHLRGETATESERGQET